MPAPGSNSLTLKGTGLLNSLRTPCAVSEAFDPATAIVLPKQAEFRALWDTGATGTVINMSVVNVCGLVATGAAITYGVGGKHQTESYLVNVQLPNMMFTGVNVIRGDLPGDIDVLIGMDIIALGDFSLTNKGGKTVFSFRHPSMHHVDYVEEHNASVLKAQMSHGATQARRPKPQKSFGKNKQRKK